MIEIPSGGAVAAYMVLWGVFTFYMWINSFYHNWNLVGVFGTLWMLFFMLGASLRSVAICPERGRTGRRGLWFLGGLDELQFHIPGSLRDFSARDGQASRMRSP